MDENSPSTSKRKTSVIRSTREIKTLFSKDKSKVDIIKKKKEDNEMASNNHQSVANWNNLPPEIVHKILVLLPTSDLFTCRLVNWQLNETCSKLLHYRPSTQLQFTFDTSCKRWYQDLFLPTTTTSSSSSTRRRNTLCQFTRCYKKSRFFPFARFKLHDLHNKKSDLLNFLDSCAHLFTSLQVNVEKLDKHGGTLLREILLEKSPNLQELIIKLDMKGRYFTRESWTLFPKNSKDSNNNNNNNDHRPLLPKLKILHLDHYYDCSQTLSCVMDIFENAINLERIEYSGGRETDKDFLDFLRSHGKIHLVKNISVDFEFLLTRGEPRREMGLVNNLHKFPEPILLPVEKLNLITQTLENCVKPSAKLIDWESAGSFINRFVQRMKNPDGSGSLKELKMNPLGHVCTRELKWPVFNSVESLYICTAESQLPIFPLEALVLNIFPVLKKLELIHNVNSPNLFASLDLIPVIPSVQILKLWAYKATAQLIKEMIVMCPNICSLTLDDVDNFPVIGTAVWKYMKNITSLHIKLKPDPKNFFPMVDSTFTGYSPQACIKFMKQIEHMKNGSSGADNSSQKFDVGNIDRENESILNLKRTFFLLFTDLMNLIIQLHISDVVYEKRQSFVAEHRLDIKIVTDVSHQFAFNLMPHVQVKMVNSCFDIYS